MAEEEKVINNLEVKTQRENYTNEIKSDTNVDGKGFNEIFDYSHPAVYLLTGKPKKGKTHMTKAILLDKILNEDIPEKDRLQFGIVLCSESSILEWKGGNKPDGTVVPPLLPEKFCFEGYDNDALENYLNFLRKTLKETGKVPRNFIIFDDLVGLLESNSGFFTQFITTYRKFNTDVFICAQYLKKNISPTIRECIQYAIMYNSKTRLTIQALFESFGGLFDRYEDFKQHFFKQTREKYSAMLFIEDIEDLDENYFSIKAPEEIPDVEIRY